ncbi:MAG: hypothetical protein WCO78_04690 [Candidatus Roizmanbacteria bacterium]
MKLPAYLTTVTAFSRMLSLIVFISMPFISFYFGYQYHVKMSSIISPTDQNIVVAKKTDSIEPASNSKTYQNAQYGFEFQYPSAWKIEENKLVKIIALDPTKTSLSANLAQGIDSPNGLISIYYESVNQKTCTQNMIDNGTPKIAENIFRSEHTITSDSPNPSFVNTHQISYAYCNPSYSVTVKYVSKIGADTYLDDFYQIIPTLTFNTYPSQL